jgi:thiosulfate reductase cytochrome b subunit
MTSSNRLSRAILAALAVQASIPAPTRALETPNPIHPTFTPLDAAGKPAARAEDVSADVTCGACHDARYVAAHDEHARAGVRVTCIQCHVDGGRLEVGHLEGGKLRREDLRIGKPTTASCGACHGVASDGASPVAIPDAFEAPSAAGRTWSLTQGEGAIFAPQRRSESFLNLEGKEAPAGGGAGPRDVPWDVHAAKLVACADCHHARNDPRRTDLKQAALPYLTADPRRLSTGEFLARPDHELARAECRSCHAPLQVHDFLPYRERHLQVLGCAACHVPGPMAPAVEMIDATAVTPAGTPLFTYRNVERRDGEPLDLNAALVQPLRPLYVLRTEADGVRRLAPVNVVSRWRWVSAVDRTEVPFATVVRAWRDGAGYAPEVLAALDTDHDRELSPAELRLDTPAKVATIAARLRALGVADPAIDGVMEPHPLAHGVAGRATALRDCGACHGAESRLGGAYELAAYLPGGIPPRPPPGSEAGGRVELAGTLVPVGAGLALEREPGAVPGGLHVLGRSRHAIADGVGLLVFGVVLGGVLLHAGARLATRRRRLAASAGSSAPRLRDVYAFGRYERLWHWTMALSGVGLIATGLAIRLGAGARLAGAVTAHDVLALVLTVNASLSLFWHLTTAAIRTFLPEPRGLLARVLAHLHHQTRGIFHGHPAPAHAEGQKLNPLQQLTYLALLNLLFPLQIASGLLIWAVGHWPEVGAALGGLSIVAPLHDLGAWLFLSFFTLHAYLVTTGRTAGEHLRAMVTGYQRVEPGPEGAVK